jgi:hypothetical protein
MSKRNPRLRAFVKLDKLGQVVPGTLVLRYKPPQGGRGLWIEIEANECCSFPQNTFDFFLAGGTGLFTLAVGGATIISATNTEGGTFQSASGQVITATVAAAASGLNNTLLVVDDTTGVVLSNQVGTGALTFSTTSTGDVYTIVATSGPTTTTTTSTTTTSTTSTSTTTTSTTSTSTTSTTTTTTTLAAGVFSVQNGVAGMSISAPTPSFYTGGTFPVANGGSTTGTLVTSTNVTIQVPLTGIPTGGSGIVRLFKNNVLIETIGVFTGPGTATFAPISFTTSDTIQVTLRTT